MEEEIEIQYCLVDSEHTLALADDITGGNLFLFEKIRGKST